MNILSEKIPTRSTLTEGDIVQQMSTGKYGIVENGKIRELTQEEMIKYEITETSDMRPKELRTNNATNEK